MANRRAVFREYMRRLDPSGEPQRALEQGFYVEPPNSVANVIAEHLELEPEGTHLLMGGIGTGKTTALLRIKAQLEATSDLTAVWIDVPAHHDLGHAKPEVLTALTAVAAREVWQKQGALTSSGRIAQEDLQRLDGLIRGYSLPDPNLMDSVLLLSKMFEGPIISVPGVVVPPSSQRQLTELQKLTSHLVRALDRRLIVLFDGLDRLPDPSSFRLLVARDLPALRQLGVGAVVVGSGALRFQDPDWLQHIFLERHSISSTAMGSKEARGFFRQVLRARVDSEVLPDSSCDELVHFAAGYVRDLIALARLAGQNAYAAGSDRIDPPHVSQACQQFGVTLLQGITEAMVRRLKDFVKSDESGGVEARHLSFTLARDTDLSLLAARLIIEIPGTPVTYTPHPTIVSLVPGLPS